MPSIIPSKYSVGTCLLHRVPPQPAPAPHPFCDPAPTIRSTDLLDQADPLDHLHCSAPSFSKPPRPRTAGWAARADRQTRRWRRGAPKAVTKWRTGAAGCAAPRRVQRAATARTAGRRPRTPPIATGERRPHGERSGGSIPLNCDRPDASVRQMADSPRRDLPPFFGSLASVRHSSHRRARQASDTYAIWLTRQHTGFTPLFSARPRGLPHTVCSLKEIIPIPARPFRSGEDSGHRPLACHPIGNPANGGCHTARR